MVDRDDELCDIGKATGVDGDSVDRTRAWNANGQRLRRQHDFHVAAQYVAALLAAVPAVRRVVLFGSVALPLEREPPRRASERRARLPWVWHECGDVDLAVWVGDTTDLKALQKARGEALNLLQAMLGLGVAHHQVDLFLMEPGTDRYIGRLCTFGTCPKGKDDCLTPGCGATPFVRLIEGFTLDPQALDPDRSILLYDADAYPLLRDALLSRLRKV